jgi:hypothetical protein
MRFQLHRVIPMPESDPDRPLPSEEERQRGPEEPVRSKTYRVFSWLVDNLVLVLILLAGGLTAAAFFLADYTIPRSVRLALTVAVALAPFNFVVSTKVRDLLWTPDWRYLVDLRAEDPDSGGLYRWPAQRFREEVDVRSGSLDWVSPWLAFGREVDPSDPSVDGTWRGTKSDRELMLSLSIVRECKQQLLEDAKRGFAIRSQASVIIRNAVRDTTMTVVGTLEDDVLPDRGEGVESAVDDALARFNIEEDVGDDDLEDEKRDQLRIEFDQLQQVDQGGAPSDD